MKPPSDNICGPLAEVDWNFEAVLEDEIIACCLWEYARESTTIGMAADQHWCSVRDLQYSQEYKLEPETKADDDKEAARIQSRLKAYGFNYDEFLEKFWNSDLAAIEIYQRIRQDVMVGARAWQEIPAEARMQLAKQVSESLILQPLALAMVGELEKLWNINKGDLDEIRSKPRPEYDDTEDGALYAELVPVMLTTEKPGEPPGKMAVAFTVDFTRFSDAEICGEMKRWLEANRPLEWKTPKRVFPTSKSLFEKSFFLSRDV